MTEVATGLVPPNGDTKFLHIVAQSCKGISSNRSNKVSLQKLPQYPWQKISTYISLPKSTYLNIYRLTSLLVPLMSGCGKWELLIEMSFISK